MMYSLRYSGCTSHLPADKGISMLSTEHYLLLANYNRRMNRQVYESIEFLDPESLVEDRSAFFKSILGTLNHILVGALIWLARFSSFSTRYLSLNKLSQLPRPNGLSDMLYSDLASLKQVRGLVDVSIVEWLSHEVKNNDFEGNLVYANTAGVVSERNFGALVSHLFNHQTHHRGQLSTILNQLDIDVGVTDLLIEIEDCRA